MSAPTVRASYGDVLGDGLAIVDADTDSDGILDLDDNCLLVPNVSQCDSDGDVFGNICDGDLSNNLETNSQDYILFRGLLGRPPGPSRPAED